MPNSRSFILFRYKCSESKIFNEGDSFMEKKWGVMLLAISSLTLCAADGYSAVNLKPAPKTVSQEKTPPPSDPHRIEIGANYTYAWVTPDSNPTTSGSLGGTQFLYEYRPPQSVYAAFAFNWRIGNTTHDSSPSRSLQDFNLQERLGYTHWCVKHDVRITAFSGFGARYMPETVKSGSFSVDFNYATLYIPIGCLLEKRFDSMFSLGFNFQWLPQIFPTVLISPLSGTHWSLKYRLDNFLFEIPFKVSAYSDRFLFSFVPFFELWNDGESVAFTTNGFGGPVGLTLNLPGNRYLFTGANVNFGVNF